MLSTILLLAAIAWVAGAGFLAVLVRRAPVAVQDENGFRTIETPTRSKPSHLPVLGHVNAA